jgi:hypothetical protein
MRFMRMLSRNGGSVDADQQNFGGHAILPSCFRICAWIILA